MCPEIVPGTGIASIMYSDSERIPGSTATHTCLPGYTQNGDLVRTCVLAIDNRTADWSLPEETCRRNGI